MIKETCCSRAPGRKTFRNPDCVTKYESFRVGTNKTLENQNDRNEILI